MVKNYLSLLRISHYTKNLYILLPLFFSGKILNSDKLTEVIPVFISFSLMASAIYIFNDIMDIAFDQLHPVKKNRPIVSGKIPLSNAYIISGLLVVLSSLLAFTVSIQVLLVVLAYFFLNLIYSVKLKNFALIDVTIISIGFNLRVIAGGLATGIVISKWLTIMVFLLSLFQALSKRMDDLYLMVKDPEKQVRQSIYGYSIEFLQIVLSMLTGVIFGLLYYVYYFTGNYIQAWRKFFFYNLVCFTLITAVFAINFC